jgi:hypothetical protein
MAVKCCMMQATSKSGAYLSGAHFTLRASSYSCLQILDTPVLITAVKSFITLDLLI